MESPQRLPHWFIILPVTSECLIRGSLSRLWWQGWIQRRPALWGPSPHTALYAATLTGSVLFLLHQLEIIEE